MASVFDEYAEEREKAAAIRLLKEGASIEPVACGYCPFLFCMYGSVGLV